MHSQPDRRPESRPNHSHGRVLPGKLDELFPTILPLTEENVKLRHRTPEEQAATKYHQYIAPTEPYTFSITSTPVIYRSPCQDTRSTELSISEDLYYLPNYTYSEPTHADHNPETQQQEINHTPITPQQEQEIVNEAAPAPMAVSPPAFLNEFIWLQLNCTRVCVTLCHSVSSCFSFAPQKI